MAHVHGTKAVDAAKKVVEEAACPLHAAAEMASTGAGMKQMMGSGMGGMMGSGMGGMMGPMMEQGGMGEMMGSGMGMMGPMMQRGSDMAAMMGSRAVTAGVATGAAVTASSTAAGHSLLRRIVTHPLVLFGAGLAVGYLIHKYREEILQRGSEIDVTE